MKQLACLLLSALFFASCQQDHYKIVGTAEGLTDGDTLFLSKDINSGFPSDTIIVEKGTFAYEEVTDSAILSLLYAQKNPEIMTTLFIEPGTIEIHLSDSASKTRIGGTAANEALQEANHIAYMYGEKIKATMQAFSTHHVSSEFGLIAQTRLLRLKSNMTKDIVDLAERNIDNAFGYFIVTNLDDEESFPPAKRNRLIEKMPAKYRKKIEQY